MYGNGHSRDRVELVHAADSVKIVRPSDGFLPSKMSRQPLRVAQPPTQSQKHSRVSKSYQSSSSTKYDDLARVVEQQRRLIDANRRTIELREARGNRVDNAPIRLAVLRNEVSYEEREMARLKMMEREAQETAARRVVAEKQLDDMQMNYTSQEQHLRSVISKISFLQAQFDVLHRRRLAVLNAARDQQRLMSSQMRPTSTGGVRSPSAAVTSATTSNDNVISRNDKDQKCTSLLAIGEHSSSRNDIRQRNISDGDLVVQQRNAALIFGRAKHASFDFLSRPRASVEPFQVLRPKPVVGSGRELAASCPPQLPVKSSVVSTFEKDRAVFGVTEKINRDISPSPPKDPYPTTSENSSENEMKPEEKKFDTMIRNGSKPSLPSVTSKMMDKQQKGIKIGGTVILDDDLLVSDLDDVKLARADQISIRPDTLRAAKRRSWALQDNSPSDETEYIRKILLGEQKKGRTHLVVGCNIGNIFAASNKATAAVHKPEVIMEEKEAAEETITTPTEYVCELMVKDIQLDELPIEIEQQLEGPAEKNTAASEKVKEETVEEGETKIKTSGVAELIKPAPEKGILRPSGTKNASRKVVFDPLALLLDAALEGEVDLVKASAAKLPNISACNDEGITALHNAICAGHYEIVRYLVDSLADVNAQDSDGWTPLHCAASCNNLPMVKLLVESGACIFAQTLSDLETPAEKCEEEEDGYEGCQLYLKAAHQGAGVVNNGHMYAAYSYDKEQDDELSFQAGACLLVLEQGVDGNAWWLCETTGDVREQGLVPRNYLSLYPSFSHRSADFKMFDLPQVPKLRGDKKEVEEERRSNSANENIQKDTTTVEQSLPIPVS